MRSWESTLSSSKLDGTDSLRDSSCVPLRGLSVTVKERMLALNWPTTSSTLFTMELSMSVITFRLTWKEPLEGLSAHFTF